jgi:UDP-glucose 6-dehydrogenase
VNVSIIGTSYVGLTTGVCLGFLGHRVTCIDADEMRSDVSKRAIPRAHSKPSTLDPRRMAKAGFRYLPVTG